MLGIKGACQTIIGTRTAGLDALRLAALRIAEGSWERAVVGAAEEHSPVINDAYRHCGVYAGAGAAPFASEGGFVTGAGAVTFILESRAAMEKRGGRPHGRVLTGATARPQSGDRPGAVRKALARMGPLKYVLSSANGTWIDRAELAGLRRCAPGAIVSTAYGHVAESFSAAPLIALAGAMLLKKMIRLRGNGLAGIDGLAAAAGDERPDEVTALCTDYAGAVSALRIGVGAARAS